jgi:YHS domain-containing protein
MKMFALVALAVFSVLVGCESNQPNRTTHVWTNNQGTFALDPINGESVEVSKAVTREYLGETYYFQSEDHAREFAANPDRYIYDDNNPERSNPPGVQGVR